MPQQRPGASKQDYGTPRVFLDAVEALFGPLEIDLAATAENTKAPLWFGPEDDSLSLDWREIGDRLCWLNPPFAKIGLWAAKCAASVGNGGPRILFLVPSSVGANWYWDHVEGRVLELQVGRLAFDGAHVKRCARTDCPGCANFPKDLMLACYGFPNPPCRERWLWRTPRKAA